ncbi:MULTISPECIES: response regulator transcription factor [Pseudoalteromonas]|jgi:two-component system OmpR family response regulator/two-component system response regulator RstA|uniref:DNA-binding response regulator n=3 Tax=Pseudoalteromonas TaxID=53246 RepID=A0AAD0XC51_9GAMM|nr:MULTISPECIES: response regulator transcription factor [Pseudoalteromonas]MDC9519753.1 response regulator transcription factor [Pseudoalteromonas sp. Angola-31]MDY6886495.1 response regulator transcription factor [Pseudomonadota bacterium]HAG41441.1 DNA-binding response regulator [Pseudoalteromonas sp.]ATC82973.1 two-component system, OmpR family, response regulator RstA [Pseudoalteromonas agarivorans DSM 14585]AYM86049.1 DNA-binding response regulator [Pseudoalteromonas agarivorans]|tara:strand:+ start:952 stop:1644 length:693 start_codon:yes stop_codon:yes gene_type:complete
MPKILLVEDDLGLQQLTKDYLEHNGLEVDVLSRGDEVFSYLENNAADLMILDIMLPGKDGFSVCRQVRDKFSLPILMLTAKGEDFDQVIGLELGADDYVVKPAEPRVLLARVNALLRRGQPVVKAAEEIQFGDLVIDKTSRIVKLNENEIVLTSHEFELLWLLASNAGEVLSREHVHQHMIGRQYDGLDRTVDVRVSRIRKKLGDNSDKPYRIKTVWGQGYLFVSDAWEK